MGEIGDGDVNGIEIKQLRERLGLTQFQLSEMLGVTIDTLGKWERGTTKIRHGLLITRALRDVEREVKASRRRRANPDESGKLV